MEAWLTAAAAPEMCLLLFPIYPVYLLPQTDGPSWDKKATKITMKDYQPKLVMVDNASPTKKF